MSSIGVSDEEDCRERDVRGHVFVVYWFCCEIIGLLCVWGCFKMVLKVLYVG